MTNEDDYLLISGLRHFAYCRRRWALVYIKQQWYENALTMDGHYMHERVHDSGFTEKRGSLILSRGMPVSSQTLGLTGECDIDTSSTVGASGLKKVAKCCENRGGRNTVYGAQA